MKLRACRPNGGIWFVVNSLMSKIFWVRSSSTGSKTNQTESNLLVTSPGGVGNGNPLKFRPNDSACQEFACFQRAIFLSPAVVRMRTDEK